MSVYTLFWFDVEDYLTPASDDALKALLEIFEGCGAQATWKVVAEKARVLQERGRTDVIRLLQRQDIGYHTDTHSLHPVLAEYLRDAGWDDGVEEVIRRERPGYEDLVRILGPASTFGQAGGSWAPQLYPFMRDAGIPLFMDEAGHIGCGGEPFWYCGVLHVNRMEGGVARMEFTKGDEGLRAGQRRFDEVRERRLGEGGGLVSIYYHPCEWATTAFWDGVNFARGAMPPRRRWQPAPLRSAAEMAAGLARFEQYLRYVAARPDVELLTGRQLLSLLPDDARGAAFAAGDLAASLGCAGGQVDAAWIGDLVLAPSEQFALVTDALVEVFLAVSEGAASSGLDAIEVGLDATPYGPVRRAPAQVQEGEVLLTEAFLEAAADARQSLRYHGRVPDAVWLGARQLAPADYLVTAGDLLRALLAADDEVPAHVRVRAGRVAGERHVRDDAWRWPIFPEGFTAPAITELARLQTWTLKPAVFAV